MHRFITLARCRPASILRRLCMADLTRGLARMRTLLPDQPSTKRRRRIGLCSENRITSCSQRYRFFSKPWSISALMIPIKSTEISLLPHQGYSKRFKAWTIKRKITETTESVMVKVLSDSLRAHLWQRIQMRLLWVEIFCRFSARTQVLVARLTKIF